MKKLFLFFVFAILALTGKAQTSAGTVVVGGGFDFVSDSPENSNNQKTSSFSFQPSVGYFVADHFVVGLDFAIITSKTSAGGTTTDKTSTFAIGPYARYYKFLTDNEKVAFFGQADFAFAFGKDTPYVGSSTKSSAFSVGISPGFSYFFSKHWSGEIGFTGLRLTTSDPNTDANNDKTTTFQFGINSLTPSGIAVRYYF